MQRNFVPIKLPQPFNTKFCVAVFNVFTVEECNAMIAKSQAKGYDKAVVNGADGSGVLVEDYRLSERCIIDDEVMASEIFRRIQHALPHIRLGGKQVRGLNERLRFLRYTCGGFFKPHMDGKYTTAERNAQSQMTMMLYLNEEYEGGATTFLSRITSERVAFRPQTGSVLLFDHAVLHEGSAVIQGEKYAVRSDVMYDM